MASYHAVLSRFARRWATIIATLVGMAVIVAVAEAAMAAGPNAGWNGQDSPEGEWSTGFTVPEGIDFPVSRASLMFGNDRIGQASVYLKTGFARSREDPAFPEAGNDVRKAYGQDAIVMEPYVVLERTRVEYVPPPHRNRVIEVIKTGQLWKHVGRSITTEANARIEADRGGYSRFTLKLGFSW